MQLSPGDRLDRYEIRDCLGVGGMGEVYRAWDGSLEREVAVKVLPAELTDDPRRRARFEREVRAVARLSHPNILAIHDFGEADGIVFAVTELLEGGTLRERKGRAPVAWREALRIAAAVADGLAAAHRAGVVHRDVKPDNLFLTRDGQVKILDFGLARMTESRAPGSGSPDRSQTRTHSGAVLGTVGYMSPEQLRGDEVGPASDVFSLGCVLYELLTGQRAFRRDSAPETMAAILGEQPPPLSDSGITVPVEVQDLVDRCLEKRAEARFQSASDLAFSLKTVATGSASRGRPRGRRRLRWIALAAAVVVAGIAAMAWLGVARDTATTAGSARRAAHRGFDEWRVSVEPFENRTGEPALDRFGTILRDRTVEGLGQVTHGLQYLPPVVVSVAGTNDAPPTRPDTAGERHVGRLMVAGGFSRQGDGLVVLAQIRDPDDGRVLYATDSTVFTPDVAEDKIGPLVDRLVGAVATHALWGLENVSHVPDFAVVHRYQAILEREWQSTSDPLPEVYALIDQDPEFLQPYFGLALGGLNMHQPELVEQGITAIRQRWLRLTRYEKLMLTILESWRDGLPGTGLDAARELQRLEPGDPFLSYFRAQFATALGRPREVVEAYSGQLERLSLHNQLGRRAVLGGLMWAYHALGQYEEALAVARRLRYSLPGNLKAGLCEAGALGALGRLDELDLLIRDCERTPPCSPRYFLTRAIGTLAASGYREEALERARQVVALSRPELEAGDLAWYGQIDVLYALRFLGEWQEYERLARAGVERFADKRDVGRANRGYLYSVMAVGIAAAHRGDREAAEAVVVELEAARRYPYAVAVLAELGELDRAMDQIRQAVAARPAAYSEELQPWNLDLAPLWGYPPFEALLSTGE